MGRIEGKDAVKTNIKGQYKWSNWSNITVMYKTELQSMAIVKY